MTIAATATNVAHRAARLRCFVWFRIIKVPFKCFGAPTDGSRRVPGAYRMQLHAAHQTRINRHSRIASGRRALSAGKCIARRLRRRLSRFQQSPRDHDLADAVGVDSTSGNAWLNVAESGLWRYTSWRSCGAIVDRLRGRPTTTLNAEIWSQVLASIHHAARPRNTGCLRFVCAFGCPRAAHSLNAVTPAHGSCVRQCSGPAYALNQMRIMHLQFVQQP